ncbi:alpha/beta hydrolase [Streptomyces sp. TP-A0874]|uniref:alpha/beta hydrolase n=1 Tax=Streptomyces sp. TP-A0874 TaxID=549819 RepID=UPI000853B417|nr:DUF1749 domain-containing protein [Streptomyces sp. TP-A0874]
MRPRTSAALAASTVLGAGAAAVAVGRYTSDAALNPRRARPLPGERSLTVHSAEGRRIVLTRSLTALRPGTYGLAGGGGHAVVGPVVEDERRGADTVVRHLVRVSRGPIEPGARMRFTPQAYVGDPLDALGLEYQDVEVAGELGTLPAWFLPDARSTWIILVHGYGTTREHPMVVMSCLRRWRFPMLAPAYRGDPGAPPAPDGLNRLGGAEWHDLEHVLAEAVRQGAERVVLYGWSTGAGMALHTATRSAYRERVAGLILDSPVLDRPATLRALIAAGHTPRPLLPLAVRAAQGRLGPEPEYLSRAYDPAELTVPTLLLHGPDDRVASWEPSRELAAARPDLVSLHQVRQAPHGAMWNADPVGYQEALRRFLTPLM